MSDSPASDRTVSRSTDTAGERDAQEAFTAYIYDRCWPVECTELPNGYVRFHDTRVDDMWLWFKIGWQLANRGER